MMIWWKNIHNLKIVLLAEMRIIIRKTGWWQEKKKGEDVVYGLQS
jgi:hypothetical protein